jgi:hypothetical protein
MLTCPSCKAPVNENSKFCNECGYNLLAIPQKASEIQVEPKRSYKLRSPILDSDILYEGETEKQHGFLTIISYTFWVFALVFTGYGIKGIYDNYTIDLYQGVVNASFLFLLALSCALLPGIVGLLLNIEEQLSFLAKEAKKDKMD